MKKILRLSIFGLITLVIAAAAWLMYIRANSDALWKIVSAQCVPNQQQHNSPSPCLEVNLDKRYVVFKDSKGPLHTLVMPTDKVTGIESPEVLKPNAPDYFSYAWQERNRLMPAGKSVDDTYLALAVNSWFGRSQNQLHIHLACLRQDVYQTLNQQFAQIGSTWQPLGATLKGHEYLAIKVSAQTLARQTPFTILNSYVQQHNDDIAKYGLAVVMTPQGGAVLLANRLKLTDFNMGSAGEILDYGCALAN